MTASFDLAALSATGSTQAATPSAGLLGRVLSLKDVGIGKRLILIALAVDVVVLLCLCAFAGPFSRTPAFFVILGVLFLGIPVLIGTLIVRDLVVGYRRYNPSAAVDSRVMRLERFASENGMVYSAVAYGPPFGGMIFRRGAAPNSFNAFTDQFTISATDVVLGNYQTGTQAFDLEIWGYVAIPLGRPRPQLLLKNRAGRQPLSTTLPDAYGAEQQLSLEGDFDRYFQLFCPGGLERDSLEFLTPDVMALLIDTTAGYDVEVIGSRLFVYSPTPFTLELPETWQRLELIIDALTAKAARGAALAALSQPVARLELSIPAQVRGALGRLWRKNPPVVTLVALFVGLGAVMAVVNRITGLMYGY